MAHQRVVMKECTWYASKHVSELRFDEDGNSSVHRTMIKECISLHDFVVAKTQWE